MLVRRIRLFCGGISSFDAKSKVGPSLVRFTVVRGTPPKSIDVLASPQRTPALRGPIQAQELA